MKLLNIDQNAKTVKGQKRGYLTGVLYLAPADLSGYEVCPKRSPGCTAACLYTSGHGSFPKVKAARVARTKMFFENRDKFMDMLSAEIEALERSAKRKGLTPVVRLNGTSDIAWEHVMVGGFMNIMDMFPQIQFYDYTKVKKRMRLWANGDLPPNYHLTFSLNENNRREAREVVDLQGNVAVVFRQLPDTFMGRPVIDGDVDDIRFKIPQGYASVGNTGGVIVGLRPKGRARKDTSGFVI